MATPIKSAIDSAVTVYPKQLRFLAAECIKKGYPILVYGKPGGGKSDIIRQAAADAEADLIVTHPTTADPTDYKGLPYVRNGDDFASFFPFGDLKRILEAKKLTAVFVDDVGQASPAVQAALMQVFHSASGDRRINDHRIPDCVTFIAASNRRGDRANVLGIIEPFKSRFHTIVTLETRLEDWRDWAYEHNVDSRVIGYLSFRPGELFQFDPKTIKETDSFPCPRTWAHVSDLIGLGLPQKLRAVSIAGSVGPAVGGEVEAFLRNWESLPDIDAILRDPDRAPIDSNVNVLWAASTALAERADKKNFASVLRYCERLVVEGSSDGVKHGQFAALCLQLLLARDPSLTHCDNPAFQKAMAGPLGALIVGE